MHWAYKYNLSEETWGHGGYYSPQNYVGLSVPLTYDARWGDDFVYRLKTGISYSQTDTHAIDFFPNDPNLQNEALIRQLETGVDPSLKVIAVQVFHIILKVALNTESRLTGLLVAT